MLYNVASKLFLTNACSSGKVENVKRILAKMWKYISGVPKVIEEEEKEKNPKAARDSKEYLKNRTRKFWDGKLADRGYSMITIRGWFGQGKLLGKWKLIHRARNCA